MMPDIVIRYGFVRVSMSRVVANEMNDELSPRQGRNKIHNFGPESIDKK